MIRHSLLVTTFVSFLSLAVSSALSAELTAEKNDQGVTIKIDGQPFAEYLINSKSKPIVWPIIGPTGTKMTRDYPLIEKVEGESKDHPHHRSLWFTHGEVNGVDFWTEVDKPGGKIGKTVHRDFIQVAGGKEAIVATRNDWVGPDGKRVCADERTLTFGGDQNQRWIDFAITIKATDGPVAFGDTKEGTFGLRVPDTMKVDAKKGGKIVDSAGQVGEGLIWGKPSPWIDYSGPVGGETLGIAILNHPSSFRYPTAWHVRAYGLFAANPFGKKDFKIEQQGPYTLPSGESVTFRYRVIFHKGDEKAAKIADAFAAYQKADK